MVKFNSAPLDRTFAALADPTRRALVTRLAEQPGLSISALAEPFALSLPAIMKHLDVLSDAGLVARTKSGRTVACRLDAAPMQEAIAWLNRYERFWSETLQRLATFLEEDHACQSNPPSSRSDAEPNAASTPSLTLKRRFNAPPAKVFAAWTDPEKVKRWMGPGETVTVGVETDARPGGRYAISMRTPAGEAHDVGGVFREVVPNEKLVFTWIWKSMPEQETVVTVLLKPDGDGTLLTLTHEQFAAADARDRHQGGWNGAFDKLEKLFV